MAYRLKLKKALSYTGIVKASKASPYVYVEDKVIAEKAVATGYFEIINDEISDDFKEIPEKSLQKMNVSELETFAAYNNISLKGITKKADIINKLKAELDIKETDGINYGSPTMTDLQEG